MQRDEPKVLKSIVFILLLTILFVGVYAFYRIHENPSVGSLQQITDLSAFPATVCAVSTGDFDGATAGTVYIYNGMMSVAATVVQNGGQVKRVHIVYSDENNGSIHSWFEGDTAGISGTDLYSKSQFTVPDGTGGCSPWWIPNLVPFKLPPEVSFDAAQ
ncbi:MAG: hypothetical protein JWM46_334 [Candidatus Kaiserbacteria bacterium]|nr:hypothetical protein [Candidatus Kaiserbacteria bacterium]